jgi:hypothetical protein
VVIPGKDRGRHLALTFVAEKPPPVHVYETVALAAAEESGDYE